MSTRYDVANAIVDIQDCRSSAAVIACFRKFILQYSIDTFTSGEFDTGNPKRVIFHAMEWPDRWRNYYFQSGLVEHDPLLTALEQEEQPFTWTELRQRRALSVAGTDALGRIAAEGWTDGLVVPFRRLGTHYGLVSLVVNKRYLGPPEKLDLTAVSVVFYDRMRHHVPREGFPVPPAGLTPREIECMRMIAQGCSDARAGELLSISGSTVHEHIERARRKLDAGNRAELVGLGMAFGIIPS